MNSEIKSRGLLAWQWEGYARYHQSRANLLLHIVLVPIFLAGNLALVVGVIRLSWVKRSSVSPSWHFPWPFKDVGIAAKPLRPLLSRVQPMP